MTIEQKQILKEFLKTKTTKEFQNVANKYGFITFKDIGEKIGVEAIRHFNSLGSKGLDPKIPNMHYDPLPKKHDK